MENYEYTLDRYSQSLTKYDIQALFRRLVRIKGNIANATKAANIKRKTYYDWEKNTDNLKLETKRKILRACLESDRLGTIEFLVKKDELSYQELLEGYLTILYEQINSETNLAELEKLTSQFDKFLRAHIGSIQDLRGIALESMINAINEKSKVLGGEGLLLDVGLIPPNELSQKFVDLLDIFRNKPTRTCTDIAKTLALPEDFVNKACSIYGYTPTSYSTEATRVNYNVAVPIEQLHSGVEGGLQLNHLYYATKRK